MKAFLISLSIFFLISNFGSSEVLKFSNAKYSGDVVDGEEHGYGVLTYDNGAIYRGEFKNGKKNGLGEYKFKGGDIYKGQFKDGTCTGVGKYILKDSKSIYVGDFVDCKYNGYGKQFFPSTGKTYWGQFVNDSREGIGYMISPNYEYNGNWLNNKRHGFGIYLDDEDDIWVGDFINNKNVEGIWISNSEYKEWYLNLKEGKKKATRMEKYIEQINDWLALTDEAIEIAVLASKKLPGQIHSCNKNINLQTKYIDELDYENLLIVSKEFIKFCSLEKPELVKHAYLSLIDSLEGLERYEEIIPIANNCIKENSKFNLCLFKKGLALYNLENYQESKIAFEKTIAIGSYDEFSEIAVKRATKWLKIIEKGRVLN